MSFVIAVVIFVLTILALISAGSQTRAFQNRAGRPLHGSIAEHRYIVLGGFDQYVLLRGRNRSAPLLVVLHGGPGTSEMPFFRLHNAGLEDSFLVVHWDQLGTGKSYSGKLRTQDLSLERLTSDLDQLVDLLRAEFGQERVLLLGHSWGSILGLEYATRFPEKVDGYVGVGVVSDQAASDAQGLAWALEQARARRDMKAVRKLESLSPPPFSLGDLRLQRRYVRKFGGTFRTPRSLLSLLLEALRTPEVTWLDVGNFFRGDRYSTRAIWPWLRDFDANQAYPRLMLPVYFLLGRHDHQVSAELAAEYFERLRAPHKELIWFEDSAHALPFEEPDRFNEEVRRIAEQVGLRISR